MLAARRPAAKQTPVPTSPRQPWYRILYVQVLRAVALGIVLGYFFPDAAGPDQWHASTLTPLGDGFIKLIKMIIAPIVFCTVVHGIASMSDLKKLGRVGGKTLLYFEIVSTIALIIGLIVVNTLQPGAGLHFDPHKLDPKALAAAGKYAQQSSRIEHHRLPPQHHP